MTEYTLTTHGSREAYHLGQFDQHKMPARINFPTFDRWLAAHDRAVKAEAWTEGFRAGLNADHNPLWWRPNPYRADQIEGATE